MSGFALRTATLADCDAIRDLIALAIRELQRDYLTPEQLESSSGGMGLDTRLIEDGTYFTVWDGAMLVATRDALWRQSQPGPRRPDARSRNRARQN